MSALFEHHHNPANNDATREAVLAAARATQARGGGGAVARASKNPPGAWLARHALASIAAGRMKVGAHEAAARLFGRESEATAVARSLVMPADTSTATWAAELTRKETVVLLRDMQQQSVFAALSQLGTLSTFNGAAAVRAVQLDAEAADAGVAWVAEGGAIPATGGAISGALLRACKAGTIAPVTNELMASGDPLVVEAMRRLVLRLVARLLDKSLLDDQAEVINLRPAGLLHGVVPIPGTAGGGLAAVSADIAAILGAMTDAGVGEAPVLLVHSATLVELGLLTAGGLSIPAIGTPFLPPDSVVGVDAAYFAAAVDEFSVEVSPSAALVMADADAMAPTMAGTTAWGGAIGTAGEVPADGGIPIAGGAGASVAGAVATSVWQAYSQALRVVAPVSFAATKPGGVQQVTGTTW